MSHRSRVSFKQWLLWAVRPRHFAYIVFTIGALFVIGIKTFAWYIDSVIDIELVVGSEYPSGEEWGILGDQGMSQLESAIVFYHNSSDYVLSVIILTAVLSITLWVVDKFFYEKRFLSFMFKKRGGGR